MQVKPREIRFFKTNDDKVPAREWLDELENQDPATYHRIEARLKRVEAGNLGDHESCGEGVWELRFNFPGPGYRIYYGEHGDWLVVLLCAGTKKTQSADIAQAKIYWRAFNA
jgi:putative addiction module killer protein